MRTTFSANLTIPRTNNPARGFHGTIAHHADATAAWRLAMAAIANATGCTRDEVCAFLASRHGRHFADDVGNALSEGLSLSDTIAAAISRWMNWRSGEPHPDGRAPRRDCAG